MLSPQVEPVLNDAEKRKIITDKNLALARAKKKETKDAFDLKKGLKKILDLPVNNMVSMTTLQDGDIKETRATPKEIEIPNTSEIPFIDETNSKKDKPSKSFGSKFFKNSFKFGQKVLFDYLGPLILSVFFTAFVAFGSDYLANRNKPAPPGGSYFNVPFFGRSTGNGGGTIPSGTPNKSNNPNNSTTMPSYNIFR